jgi:hypothetical protein
VLAAGVAPAVHAQATLRWRCASSFPKALDTLFGVCDVFAKKVGELSGGRFTITTHAAGELMPAFGVLDADLDLDGGEHGPGGHASADKLPDADFFNGAAAQMPRRAARRSAAEAQP